MYKYGIAYYETVEGVRQPLTGLTVLALRPGEAWADGRLMIEVADGYYEISFDSESDCGYYEVWDDLNNPSGAFSGKTFILGKLDGRAYQNTSILANHISNGAISASKIASGAIDQTHISSSMQLGFDKVIHELVESLSGVGDPSSSTPPDKSDTAVIHVLANDYSSIPAFIITPSSEAHYYIKTVDLADKKIVVTIGVINPDEVDIEYTLLAIPR